MRRPRCRLEGQDIDIMASGMEYPIHGRLNGIVQDVKYAGFNVWHYEIETSDGNIYLINVDEVFWMSTKKRKHTHLKVVDLHATKKV